MEEEEIIPATPNVVIGTPSGTPRDSEGGLLTIGRQTNNVNRTPTGRIVNRTVSPKTPAGGVKPPSSVSITNSGRRQPPKNRKDRNIETPAKENEKTIELREMEEKIEKERERRESERQKEEERVREEKAKEKREREEQAQREEKEREDKKRKKREAREERDRLAKEERARRERAEREERERVEKERLEREEAEREERDRKQREAKEQKERKEKERLERVQREKTEREEKARLEREKREEEERQRLQKEEEERVQREAIKERQRLMEEEERLEKQKIERSRQEMEVVPKDDQENRHATIEDLDVATPGNVAGVTPGGNVRFRVEPPTPRTIRYTGDATPGYVHVGEATPSNAMSVGESTPGSVRYRGDDEPFTPAPSSSGARVIGNKITPATPSVAVSPRVGDLRTGDPHVGETKDPHGDTSTTSERGPMFRNRNNKRPNSPRNPRMAMPAETPRPSERTNKPERVGSPRHPRMDLPSTEDSRGHPSSPRAPRTELPEGGSKEERRHKKKKRRTKPISLIASSYTKVPDYDSYTADQKTRAWTALETRLDDLQHAHPEWDIREPDPTKETLTECHNRFIQYITDHKKAKFIAETSEHYIIGMVVMWLMIEVVCVMVNLPAGGYTMLQFSMLNRYEDILIDIGEEKWESRGGGKSKRGTVWDIVWSSLIVGVGFILFKLLLQGLGEEYSQKLSAKMVGMLVGDENGKEGTLFRLTGVAEIFKLMKGFMAGDLSGLMDLLGG